MPQSQITHTTRATPRAISNPTFARLNAQHRQKREERNERDACEGGFQNSPTLQFTSRGDSLQCHKIGAAQRIRRGCANAQTSNASLSPKSVASFFLASGRYYQARRRAARPETLGGTGATRAGQRTCHATHWKSQGERSCLAENTPLHTLCTSTEAKY